MAADGGQELTRAAVDWLGGGHPFFETAPQGLPLGLFPGLRTEPAAAALLRTVSLVGAAVGFALLQRRSRAPELSWAAYATLALMVPKLVLLDLFREQPLALFFTLSAIGAAVIVVPRILRRTG